MKVSLLKKDFSIRKAGIDDGQEIFELVKKAFREYYRGKDNVDHLMETVEDVNYDLQNNTVLIVEGKDKILGSLRLERRDEQSYYLKRFAVLPGFQKQGLGTLLFKAAMKEVKAQGGNVIFLYSSTEEKRLVKFYQKLGFNCQEIDTEKGYARGLWIKNLAK